MDLQDLKQTRYGGETAALPIPEAELCRRYESVFTGAVNDVLREMGYLYQTLPHDIQPLHEDMKVAGICFTVKGSQNLDLTDEMMDRARMLEAITPNSVCVWDTSGDEESAQWGEIMTLAARGRGCRGAVVDGGVRDTRRILQQGFPVFCRYRTSNGMLGRFRMIGYQIPIRIGETLIRPGDVIFGDIDGVIVVPRDIAVSVLERAEAIRDGETDIRRMVQSGASPVEVVEHGGYF